MRLTAHHEITTSAETQPLENAYLELTEIFTKIAPTNTPLIQKIIADETPTADTSLPKNEHTGPQETFMKKLRGPKHWVSTERFTTNMTP